jgi:hypothetical protein
VDWTALVLSFKGVLLEGLEVAFIAVSVGLAAQALTSALLGAAAAFVVVAGAGVLTRGLVQRIPRRALQLVVGTLLSSFGTFWAVQGLGVAWPGGEVAIAGLVGWYLLAAAGYVGCCAATPTGSASRRWDDILLVLGGLVLGFAPGMPAIELPPLLLVGVLLLPARLAGRPGRDLARGGRGWCWPRWAPLP